MPNSIDRVSLKSLKNSAMSETSKNHLMTEMRRVQANFEQAESRVRIKTNRLKEKQSEIKKLREENRTLRLSNKLLKEELRKMTRVSIFNDRKSLNIEV